MNNKHPIHFIKFLRDQTRQGAKTITSRIINPQPHTNTVSFMRDKEVWIPVDEMNERTGRTIRCKYGQPGHYLWMHEPVEVLKVYSNSCQLRYLDDGEELFWPIPERIKRPSIGPWPGRTLPAEWGRHWLKVVAVRVRRVHSLSITELRKEGLIETTSGEWLKEPNGYPYAHAHEAFKALWDGINESRGFPFESNPWTFRIEYQFLKDSSEVWKTPSLEADQSASHIPQDRRQINSKKTAATTARAKTPREERV